MISIKKKSIFSNAMIKVLYVLLLFVGVALSKSVYAFIPVLISFLLLITMINRFEFFVSLLLVGIETTGYIGYSTRFTILGKVLGAFFLLLISKYFYNLPKKILILMTILWSISIIAVFYYMGPKTPVCTEKLLIFIYNICIFSCLFYILFEMKDKINFVNVAMLLVAWVVMYMISAQYFELSKFINKVSLLTPGYLRLARTSLRLMIIDSNLHENTIFSYQVVGNYAALSIIFLLSFYSNEKISDKFFFILFIVLAFFCIYASGSRQSFFILLICLFSLNLTKPKNSNTIKAFTFFFLMISICFFAYSYFLKVAFVVDMVDADRFTESINRSTNFDAAIELIKQKPLMGFGLGGYHIPSLKYKPGEMRLFPHNVFLELLSETGIIGTFLFLGGWFFLYVIYIRSIGCYKLFTYKFNKTTYLPIVLFYFISAMMNEILTNSIAFFIILAFYIDQIWRNEQKQLG